MTKKETALEIKSPWTQKQVNLITKTVAKGATIDELHLFLYTAKKVGLDPLTRQIHFVKRAGTGTIQVGIDGLRSIAERSHELAGIDDAIFDDGFKYEPGKEPTNPSKATVTIYRMVDGVRVSFTASARWKEYKPAGNQDFMWKRMPYLMLAKCAEALALRKAFPNDLSGVYTNEELAHDVITADIKVEEPEKEPKKEEPKAIEGEKKETQKVEFECHGCGNPLTKAENDYSKKMFGKPFCRECQKGQERIK